MGTNSFNCRKVMCFLLWKCLLSIPVQQIPCGHRNVDLGPSVIVQISVNKKYCLNIVQDS